jgi:hypothetical protein
MPIVEAVCKFSTCAVGSADSAASTRLLRCMKGPSETLTKTASPRTRHHAFPRHPCLSAVTAAVMDASDSHPSRAFRAHDSHITAAFSLLCFYGGLTASRKRRCGSQSGRVRPRQSVQNGTLLHAMHASCAPLWRTQCTAKLQKAPSRSRKKASGSSPLCSSPAVLG